MLIGDPNDRRAMELIGFNPETTPVFAFTPKQRRLAAEYADYTGDGRIIYIPMGHVSAIRRQLKALGVSGNPDAYIRSTLQTHYRDIYEVIDEFGFDSANCEVKLGKLYGTISEEIYAAIAAADAAIKEPSQE